MASPEVKGLCAARRSGSEKTKRQRSDVRLAIHWLIGIDVPLSHPSMPSLGWGAGWAGALGLGLGLGAKWVGSVGVGGHVSKLDGVCMWVGWVC